MAIQLPKYQRQVGSQTSGRTQIQPATDVGAVVMEGAVGLGLEAGKAISAYSEKKKKAQFAADKVKYDKGILQLDSEIEQATNDYLKGAGNSYKDVHDEVVMPMLDKFGTDMADSGLSKDSLDAAKRAWEVDSQKMQAKSIHARERMELDDMVENLKEGYFMASNAGDEEAQKGFEEQLRNVAGEKTANDVISLGVYNKNVNNMYTLTDTDDIDAYMNSEEAQKMNPGQYQQFRYLANNHKKQLTANKYAPAKKDLMSVHKKGELTEGYIRSKGLPKSEENVYIKMLADDVSESYEKNPEVIDGLYAEVDSFLDGKYGNFSSANYTKLLEEIEKAELPASVKMDIMLPIIEGQEDASVNAPFFTKQKNVKVYDEGVSTIMKEYRDAFNSANSGMSATVKMYGFGNGYKKVMTWIGNNESDIKNGNIPAEYEDIIREAVRPAVSNRIKIESRKSAQNILHGELKDQERLDAIWGE